MSNTFVTVVFGITGFISERGTSVDNTIANHTTGTTKCRAAISTSAFPKLTVSAFD